MDRIAEAVVEVQNAPFARPAVAILFRVHLGFLYYVQRNYGHSIGTIPARC